MRNSKIDIEESELDMAIEDEEESQGAERTPKKHGSESKSDTLLKGNLLNSQFNKFVSKLKTERIANNRRLIITKIILENFKSYNGIKIIGPFHKSFTSVVGPNGSGKSNTIESLLFVFGKRAKWMRLNKLSELIHHSAKYPNYTKASVEVHFQEIIDKDDPEAFDPIEGTDFSVKRTVNTSNVSKYEITGKEATQTEVTNLLMSKGIDLNNNRFLILQGEVEQISLMKPKSGDANDPGLLEYLEEIIGSNVYKEQIDNLEIEHDKCVDLKKEKFERVKISEGDLTKLDDAKNIAVDFIKKEHQCYQLLNLMHQIERWRKNDEVLTREEEVNKIDIKYKEEKKRLVDKRKENEDFNRQYNDLKREKDQTDRKMANIKKNYDELSNKDEKLQMDKKHCVTNEVKLAEQLKELEKSYQQIIERASEIERVLPGKEKELDKLTNQKDKSEEKVNDLLYRIRGQTDKIRKQRAELESKLNPISLQFNEAKNQLDELENEFSLLTRRHRNVQLDLDEIQTSNKELDKHLTEFTMYAEQIDQAIQRMREVLAEHQNNYNQIVQKETDLTDNLQDIQGKLEEYRQKSRDQKGQSAVLSEILKAQQRKELKGICGRLGDLGAIDEKYDVAVTTACSQLDHIVVNKFEDAQRAVEYLRANKIGKASFIALDKIEWVKDQMERHFAAPKQSQRLFDLIRVKNSIYKIAFYFALKDTLVCEDIDIATNIAYGTPRHRVATLRGQLIDISGTMSGGGKARRGGMNSKLRESISEDALQDLVDETNLIQEELAEVRREKNEIEKLIQEVQKDEAQAIKERQRTKMDIEYRKQQIDENKNKVDQLNKQSTSKEGDDKRKNGVDKQIKSTKKEMDKIGKEMKAIEEEIEQLDTQLAAMGGKELGDEQKKLERYSREREEVNDEVTKMLATIQNRSKQLQKNKKEQEELKKKLDKIKISKESLDKEIKAIEEDAMTLLTEMRETEERKNDIDKKYSKFGDKHKTIADVLHELKVNIDKIATERDEVNRYLKKAKDEYNVANNRLESIRRDFKNLRAQYDFLNELEEIANFKVTDLENLKDMEDDRNETNGHQKEDNMDIEKEGPKVNISKEKGLETRNRGKKVKINFDPEVVFSVEVEQDITMAQLETLEKMFDDIKLKHSQIEEKLKSLQPNINSINDYKAKYLEHKSRMKDLNDVKHQLYKLKNEMDVLKKKRFDEFMDGFHIISTKLKETYQLITMGGDAELELLDSLDPFSEGVVFSVRPPKKSWKHMSKLSGGEKTLSSLALVFALHYFKPTPLYFMDEIDAALDYKNVSIVGNYIKEKTKNAQFIIISLRNNMFELSDRLVGVYKTNDTTKTISINPNNINKNSMEVEKD